jgi:hypothetical protein
MNQDFEPINTGENRAERDDKGRFLNGNPGKPKGVKHHSTRLIRNVLFDVFEQEFTPEKITGYMASLDDVDKLRFMVNLLPYMTPRIKPEPENLIIPNPEGGNFDLSVLSDDELRTLLAIQEKVKDQQKPIQPPIAWVKGGEPITEIKRIIIDPKEKGFD